MIIPNGTDPNIEKHKQKLGLSGDAYLLEGHLLETLESHKRLFPDSRATTIQEAEAERIAFEEEQARIRAEESARAEQERLTQEQANEDEEEETEQPKENNENIIDN